ncbi:mechanosensitive ion channel family protein [Flavobacteriaceae bacterium]|jgi:miniconductance mechanosensitive channel|nr:mechanosensitive ion channel family protein [Flavobacteriaceae bacterium]MDC3259408.1 mechanosensitive ion channel family protein [Flavobacteriaceae bacterium]
MLKIIEIFISALTNQGFGLFWAELTSRVLLVIIFLVMSSIIYWVSRRVVLGLFYRISRKTKTHFDDLLIKNKTAKRLAYLFPVLFLYQFLPEIFSNNQTVFELLKNILEAFSIVIIINLIRALLKTINDYIKTIPSFKDKPIDSYIQVIMIFLWFIGGILILSVLTGKDVGTFLTTLGALSAVLLFVFKDTILGFVASVQITVNDTVRIGDWITMPGNNADGDVISISLSAVQIQNFDKTITSIPTYKLLSDAFINWRGMSDSDGRRIKRSLLIKISSIRFLEAEELVEIEKIERIKPFIEKRKAEIESSNQREKNDKKLLINGRNFTNLGLFRNYTEAYLKEHPMVNPNMTIMCRQLSPTAQGIPLEVYVFSVDKDWKNYEHIAADIFDHLLAATKYFNLECFELSPNFISKT